MKRTFLLQGMAVLLAILCGSAQAAQYRVHELGVLPGDGWGAATRINNLGQVLGYSRPYGANDSRGVFLWSKGTGMVDIQVEGKLDKPGGINDSGQVVGTGIDTTAYDETATIRNPDGSLSVLPGPADETYDGGLDINNAGQVVGWSYSGLYYALLWDTNGDIITLGGGGDPERWCRATDINNAGQVIWTGELSSGPEQAYRWDRVNGSVALALLGGTDSNIANAINDSGWIAGKSGNHAVLWNPTGSIVDLGTSSFQWGNAAYGINNLGQIVGELGGRAVLWNADGSVAADLDSFLGGEYGSGASAINDNGWVVGYRLDEYGNQQAVLWEPVPEPSSILTLAGGMLCLAGLLKRRRS